MDDRTRGWHWLLFRIGLAAVLLAGACRDAGSAATATRADSGSSPAACGTYDGKGCAPTSQRVDLTKPSFSHPTAVTNPLFPIHDVHSAVLLGKVDGQPFRSETTLLPNTRTIEWEGNRVETLVSQYTAYRNGRIEEVALDFYAQADDGSVWYFGEDVIDYRDGTAVTTEGTWLAGREGAPAMIMPAHPKVGDVYRTENVVGVVFEEVRVKEVGKTVAGPHGPVTGAIVGEELHLDGSREDKIFAPGYGEFSTGAGDNIEALAVAVPADAQPASLPVPLQDLAVFAAGLLGAVQSGDWDAATSISERISASWNALQKEAQPRLVVARLDGSVRALTEAVRKHSAAAAGQAAIDTGQSVLDLELRYRTPAEVDRQRFERWCLQILVDAAGRDGGAVSGDVAALEWIRDRFAPTLEPAEAADIEARLGVLRAAADGGRLTTAADHAARLGQRVRRI